MDLRNGHNHGFKNGNKISGRVLHNLDIQLSEKKMTLKSTLLSSILILLSFTLSAQTLKENIARDFMHLNELTQKGEYAKIADMLPEKMFDLVSKDDLIEAMSVGMNNKQIKVSILDTELLNISTPEKIDGCYYSELKYTTRMAMSFIPPEKEGIEEKNMRVERTVAALANTFGSNNVQYDPKKEEFSVLAKKRSYGMSSNDGRDWKFINIDRTQRVMLERILPKEILARELDYN